jgi:hypothetical protein
VTVDLRCAPDAGTPQAPPFQWLASRAPAGATSGCDIAIRTSSSCEMVKRYMDNAVPPRDAPPHEARYANYFNIGHNAFEFILDFGQFYSNGERGHVHTRIVAAPGYAKALLMMLHESIDQYERTFGPLDPDSE